MPWEIKGGRLILTKADGRNFRENMPPEIDLAR